MRSQISHVLHRNICDRLVAESNTSGPRDLAYQRNIESLQELKAESDERFLNATRAMAKLTVSNLLPPLLCHGHSCVRLIQIVSALTEELWIISDLCLLFLLREYACLHLPHAFYACVGGRWKT